MKSNSRGESAEAHSVPAVLHHRGVVHLLHTDRSLPARGNAAVPAGPCARALFALVPRLSCASCFPSPAHTSAICAQAWLRDFFSEGATVLFYCITGFKFRPGAENPYIQVKSEDEYGLAEQRDRSVELELGQMDSSSSSRETEASGEVAV